MCDQILHQPCHTRCGVCLLILITDLMCESFTNFNSLILTHGIYNCVNVVVYFGVSGIQAGLWEETREHKRGEGKRATEAQV